MSGSQDVVVGVLALQGDFAEHAVSLGRAGAEAREVRLAGELAEVDGLIIPGGESTTIARLLIAYGLREPIVELGSGGFPIWGTCAGAILLATEIETLDRPGLGLLPMRVERNGYGRQIDSFEAELDGSRLGGGVLPAVFIRAPRIRSVGSSVEVLLEFEGEPVGVEYGSLSATTFHPELTGDVRLHERFARRCAEWRSGGRVLSEEGASAAGLAAD